VPTPAGSRDPNSNATNNAADYAVAENGSATPALGKQTDLIDNDSRQRFPTTIPDNDSRQRFPTTIPDNDSRQRFPTTIPDND